jgi:signal transduction histidine kinase
MEPLLEDEGYEVWSAENGREALRWLQTDSLPDIIVLDLKMPVMDGWQFRAIQKDHPKLSRIPVVALSADGSAQAASISAEAFLSKPVGATKLLATIDRILLENERQAPARSSDTELFAALGQMAANVGHEINNPLTIILLNLSHSLEALRPSIRSDEAPPASLVPEVELEELKTRLVEVTAMLEDCQNGGERIRDTVRTLQSLSVRDEDARPLLDVHKIIELSVSRAWDQIRHRARLIRTFGRVPSVVGNSTTLGQVFLNLLVNAAQAIPEGYAERNEIRVSTSVRAGTRGTELVVEISDSGEGIAPEIVTQVFEPFFSTKATGQNAGLGLSISHQTVSDHGGRITVESEQGKGSVFRVFLPIGPLGAAHVRSVAASTSQAAPFRGRVVVRDDEPLIGRDQLKQVVAKGMGEHSDG